MLWYTVQFSYLLPPCQCTHSMNSISILRPTYTRHNPFHSLILSLFPLPTHFYCFTILCGSSAEANALYLLHHIFSRRSQERHKKNRVIISLPSRAPEKVKNRLLVDCVMACVCVASIAQFLHRNHKVQRRFMQHCFFFSIFVEILLWLRPTSNKRISSLHCVSELIKWGIDWLRLRQCMHACCASDAFFPLYSIHFFFVRDRLEISFIHYISFSLLWEPGTQLISHMTMDFIIFDCYYYNVVAYEVFLSYCLRLYGLYGLINNIVQWRWVVWHCVNCVFLIFELMIWADSNCAGVLPHFWYENTEQ